MTSIRAGRVVILSDSQRYSRLSEKYRFVDPLFLSENIISFVAPNIRAASAKTRIIDMLYHAELFKPYSAYPTFGIGRTRRFGRKV